MKRNIILDKEEISALIPYIKDSYIQQCSEKDVKPKMKFNSNPVNYESLNSIIAGKITMKVGVRFLCKLLYYSQMESDEVFTFRKDRVDGIYQFVSGKDREQALQEGLKDEVKLYYIPTPSNQKKERKRIVEAAKEKFNLSLIDDHFQMLDKIGSNKFWSIIDGSQSDEKIVNEKILIFFNVALLQDAKSVKSLIDVFNNYSAYLFVDPKILFLFSDDLLIGDWNILTLKGKSKFLEYWSTTFNTLKNFRAQIGDEFDEVKVINEKIYQLLIGLNELYNANWDSSNSQDKGNVEKLQPLISRINHYEVEDLDQIYKANLADKFSSDYLCVIAYQKYYENNEQEEMKTYFNNFNNKLLKIKNNRIFRIFSIESSKDENGNFVSGLSDNKNKNVYEYLRLHRKSNARSYLLMYTDKQIVIKNKQILFEQDYVIKVPNKNLIKFDYLKNNIKVKIFKNTDGIRLYFAYPEDMQGRNKMIYIKNQNHISIKKWLKDFLMKIQEMSSIQNDSCKIIPFDDANLKEIKRALRIKK